MKLKLPDNEIALWYLLAFCIVLIIAAAIFFTIYFIGIIVIMAAAMLYSYIKNRKFIMSFREYKKEMKKHGNKNNT
jgi:membrane protein YdbS with pleckstrin-like domain